MEIRPTAFVHSDGDGPACARCEVRIIIAERSTLASYGSQILEMWSDDGKIARWVFRAGVLVAVCLDCFTALGRESVELLKKGRSHEV